MVWGTRGENKSPELIEGGFAQTSEDGGQEPAHQQQSEEKVQALPLSSTSSSIENIAAPGEDRTHDLQMARVL